ncbi:MAG TPA: hypothetical protein PKH24_01430 [Sedimentisphaerales bacterium]|jgi:protocatechuate 3,4-dioxygenase beta subunit|nr:hypothetical protein [Sedimentisphaerales bacterium]HNU28135.1 hypothetical protein [Sedimentisphaerales bacterium]
MQAAIGAFTVALSLCLGGLAPTGQEETVSGRVVDYLARPVQGAEVALYEEVHDSSTDRKLVYLRDRIVRTDAEGRFTFQSSVHPLYYVFAVVRKEGLALGWDVLTQSADNVIVLEQPCVLAGVVVDLSGRPVSGAKVLAVPKTSYLRRLEQRPILGPAAWLTTETDAQGRFRFDSFSADVSSDFWVEAPGRSVIYTYTPQRLTVSGFEAGRTDVRLVVPEEAAVRGLVVDAGTDEPIADAHIVLHADMIDHDPVNPYLPVSTVTDKDGRFVFQGIPHGWHYIDASAPYETGLADRRVRFEIPAGPDTQEIPVALRRGGVVEIEAREERTGEPIPDLSSYFWEVVQDERSGFYKDARTGADGVVRLCAPVGLSKFSGTIDGYSPWQYEGQVYVTAGQTAKSRITLRRYLRVCGVVVDEQGRSVSGATVNDGVTDDAGRFEVPFPSEVSPFGKNWIVCSTRDNLAAIVNVQHDDVAVRVTLKPALAVSGRITDPNGIGIPAARVALDLRASRELSPYGPEVIADSQGGFELAAVVPPGGDVEYRISVSACGYGTRLYQKISIVGEPGTHVQIDPIVLSPADQSVTGMVVDADGNPVAGKPMAVHGVNQPSRYPVTDSEGRFLVRRVCRGPLRIRAGFSSVREECGMLQAEGGDRDVKVVMGQDSVHLRCVSLVGKPLPIEALGDGGLPNDAAGRRVLLCFFDWQQRPSRNMIAELTQRVDQFSRQDVVLVAIQAAQTDQAELDQWIADKHIAFPVRTIAADERTIRLTWGVQSLPWLILADRAHIVRAEGPQLAAIERQIGASEEREK